MDLHRISVSCAFSLLFLLPSLARANPPDLFGIGAASMGRGGGGIAITGDASASWLNPAGLGNIHRGRVDAGFHLGWERFEAMPPIASDENHDGYVNPDNPYDVWTPEDYVAPSGLHFQAARGLGRYLRGGFSLTLPMQSAVLIRQEDPQYPYYVRWKNRPQRLNLTLSGALRFFDGGLSVGGGLTVLARVALKIGILVDGEITTTTNEKGETTGINLDLVANPNDIEVDVRPALAPIAGVQWDLGTLAPPLKGLRLGAVYRGPIDLRIEPTELNLDVYFRVQDLGDLGEITIPLEADILFRILDFYTPRQVGLGVGYTHPRAAAYLDLTWNQWSKAIPSVAYIDEENTTVNIGVVDLDAQAYNARDYDPLGWRDTWTLRVGGEIRPPSHRMDNPFEEIGVVLRAGYSYDPTYVPDQTGLTNFLDSDVHMFAAGIGAWTRDPFHVLEGPVFLDLSFQYHHLAERKNVKDESILANGTPAGYPEGGSITAGGRVITLGASVGFEL